eukprot:GFUD01015518.1.p1 GENE.GFUD01015518.1~~GFUD01015518.1.p1  ORF type:complete len:691 (-),score=152.70 GFUD01015518.1:104-2176(-)
MWHHCGLDRDNCVDLDQVLKVFSAPITEEHAWALVYQSLEILDNIIDDDQTEFYRIETARDILLTSDGCVHFNTFYLNRHNRNILRSESLAIADLGAAIYDALDYSLPDDSQRTLSTSLENLIEKMTSADEDEEGEDEGIDEGHVKQSGLCRMILELCRHHLAAKSEAECHYRAVCRALVAEALEISSFMEKMGDNNNNEELRELAMGDWANIWSDVMGQLRQGIKLKKVEYSKTPTEFELTPYEMLMDDVRKRSYKLKQTEIPLKVKTDAKDVILDFIRSRPPLKSASRRVLPPRKKELTPMELLMEDIRGTDATKSLKKTNFPDQPATSAISNSNSKKKSISPDLSFFEDILNFDDETPQSPPKLEANNKICHPSGLLKVKSEHKCTTLSTRDGELARNRTKLIRKSSLVNLPEDEPNKLDLPQSKPESTSRTECVLRTENMDLVKLSLFEFSHIRTQETKAEVDGFICGAEKKRDLELGKICFSCKDVRFKMINWAYACKFCKKNVCSKCLIKLRLPEEKLKDVTVASLISQLSPSNESKPRDNNFSEQSPNDNQFSKRTSFVRASLGRISLRSSRQTPTPSVENIPKTAMVRSKTNGREDILQVKSMNMPKQVTIAPKLPNVMSARPRMLRSNTTLTSSDLEGMTVKNKTQQSNVCVDCKHSLVQTIRSMSMKCRETRKIIPGLKF